MPIHVRLTGRAEVEAGPAAGCGTAVALLIYGILGVTG